MLNSSLDTTEERIDKTENKLWNIVQNVTQRFQGLENRKVKLWDKEVAWFAHSESMPS